MECNSALNYSYLTY